MNSTTGKDIAELVGITAIVASLLFVGLELRQSHQIAIAAEYQERVATVIDIYNTQIQSEIVLRYFGLVGARLRGLAKRRAVTPAGSTGRHRRL